MPNSKVNCMMLYGESHQRQRRSRPIDFIILSCWLSKSTQYKKLAENHANHMKNKTKNIKMLNAKSIGEKLKTKVLIFSVSFFSCKQSSFGCILYNGNPALKPCQNSKGRNVCWDTLISFFKLPRSLHSSYIWIIMLEKYGPPDVNVFNLNDIRA